MSVRSLEGLLPFSIGEFRVRLKWSRNNVGRGLGVKVVTTSVSFHSFSSSSAITVPPSLHCHCNWLPNESLACTKSYPSYTVGFRIALVQVVVIVPYHRGDYLSELTFHSSILMAKKKKKISLGVDFPQERNTPSYDSSFSFPIIEHILFNPFYLYNFLNDQYRKQTRKKLDSSLRS